MNILRWITASRSVKVEGNPGFWRVEAPSFLGIVPPPTPRLGRRGRDPETLCPNGVRSGPPPARCQGGHICSTCCPDLSRGGLVSGQPDAQVPAARPDTVTGRWRVVASQRVDRVEGTRQCELPD